MAGMLRFERKVMSDEEAASFVAALYRGILRREPDTSGMETYVKFIQSGRSAAFIAEAFASCAEFTASAPPQLFVPPGHFYSPIVDVGEASRHLNALAQNPPETLLGITIDRPELVRNWHSLLPFLTTVPFPDAKDAGYRYAFENPAYSWGDASILHSMLRRHRPKRLIEIGSGYSSACSLDTVEKYLDGDCEITFIEPYPQLLRDLIGEETPRIRVLDKPVQEIPLETFDQLEAGDFLFIDSTHVLRTGSDVCFELFEILPRLATGVFVHFHDMFWPFEYPRQWVIDENRSWNEVYAVRAFLTQNASWRIVMFNDYFAKYERPLIESTFPKFMRNTGGALWLERC
jgi:hypothetical protein